MFIILVTYTQSIEMIDRHLLAHRTFLDECYKKNHLITSGPQNPRTGGVLVSQLTDRNVLESMLAQDPFHLEKLATYQVIEFSPIKFHPDFAGFVSAVE